MKRALPPTITGAAVLGTIRGTANVNPAPDTPSSAPRLARVVQRAARTRTTTRLERRAALAATYAGLLGAETPAQDIHDAMQSVHDGGQHVTGAMLAHGLAATGLIADVRRTSGIEAAPLPALALMKGGQAVLVLSADAQSVTLYEAGAPGARTEVPRAEFAPFFTGEIVRAEATLGQLDARHGSVSRKGHWFWTELFRYKRQFAEVALGSFVANLLAIAVALFSLQVYDRVIPHQSTATLWVLATGVGVAILLEAGLKIARARLMDGTGKAVELNVQNLLMARVLGMRSDKRPAAPSALFSTMREFASVREFFTAASVGALTDLPFILLFLVLVATIGGPVVWVLVAGGVLMVLPGLLFQNRMLELSRQTQGASAKASRLLQEAIFELDTIKAGRGEDRFLRLWTELTMLQALKSSDQRRLSAALTFWAQGVQQATYVSAVTAGTYLVFAGDFTVGTIIAVGILSGRTLAPLSQLAGTLARWSNVKNALDGLDALANSPQDEDETRSFLRRDSFNGAYELREVAFGYDDAPPSLDVPALVVRPGQHIAVLGANGSGKSTFLKILSGLYAPTSGRVLIDGVDMGHVSPRDLRRGIGYLSQDVRLFAGSLRDNLNLTGLERDDDRLLAALDFAGLGPFVRSHPRGLDLAIHDAGEGLSADQRQSIGWARIWLADPSVVLLDEPTAALDTTLEATLVSRLEHWLAGRTAIIATHRMPILALTERTLILQQGRLMVDGPRDEVLAHLREAKSSREAVL